MEGSGIGQFIPLILIFVIFYFFLIRPQQKKVKEHKAMVEGLKRGDKVWYCSDEKIEESSIDYFFNMYENNKGYFTTW